MSPPFLARQFAQTKLFLYVQILTEEMTRDVTPDLIINMDESGFSQDP
jgi:hypothetical protein